MSDDEKELLKNLDLLMNMDLIQNEKDWDVIQNLDEAETTDKGNESGEDLKLDEE